MPSKEASQSIGEAEEAEAETEEAEAEKEKAEPRLQIYKIADHATFSV